MIIQLFSALHQVSSAQIGFSRVMSWPKDWLLKRLLVQCLRSEKLEKNKDDHDLLKQWEKKHEQYSQSCFLNELYSKRKCLNVKQ